MDKPEKNHPGVEIARIFVAAGGAITLAIVGLVPGAAALGALVLIALPTDARAIVRFINGEGGEKKPKP